MFAILVFGCVSDQVRDTGSCLYGKQLTLNSGNIDCCNFATAVSVIGLLLSVLFLLKDISVVVLDFSHYTKVRSCRGWGFNAVIPTCVFQFSRVVAIVETVSSSLWAFMWFVAFVFTAHQLRITDSSFLNGNPVAHCARAAVAFSFFSTLLWVWSVPFETLAALGSNF